MVPNPSFEYYVSCPNGTNQTDLAVPWSSYNQTPDYFNGCAQNGLNVPNSIFGFQYAHTGQGMIGISTHRNPLSANVL